MEGLSGPKPLSSSPSVTGRDIQMCSWWYLLRLLAQIHSQICVLSENMSPINQPNVLGALSLLYWERTNPPGLFSW